MAVVPPFDPMWVYEAYDWPHESPPRTGSTDMVFDLRRSDYEARSQGTYTSIAMADRGGSEGHHSVGTYGASTAKQFGKKVNADHLARLWIDTFYGVLIWTDGTIIEGRPWTARSGSVRRLTICAAGNFEHLRLNEEMKAAIRKVRAAAISQGLDPSVGWHGQRAATACPGRNAVPFWRELGAESVTPPAPKDYAIGDRVMRLVQPRQQGKDVATWQSWLIDWYDARGKNPGFAATGEFGPATSLASSEFMKLQMGVETNDPRVGPRTIEHMELWRANQADGGKPADPDFWVAGIASNDVDEGMARVVCKKFGWRFLRWPEQALDYRIGTAVAFGAVANQQVDQPTWDEIVKVSGGNRDETAAAAARYILKDGDTRTAPKP